MESPAPKRGWFTPLEALAIGAVLLLGCLFFITPAVMNGGPAPILECANNLKQIYTFALHYAEKKGTAFPLAQGETPRAHDSLNLLIAFEPEGLSPDMFVCPGSDAKEATRDEQGRYVLDEDTCSYAWTSTPLRSTARSRPLASDKYIEGYEDAAGVHGGHKGMNVLMADGSVQFLEPSRLPPDTLLPEGLTR